MTEPSSPALMAIWRAGQDSALRTISTPVFWSSFLVRRPFRCSEARSSATPPPGTMPSSTAARVACIASSTFVDMMPDNIDQNLHRGADSLQLFHCFIDQRLSLYVELFHLFDYRLFPIEKIDQRLARRQRFLNLSKLCIAETGNVANEVKEP